MAEKQTHRYAVVMHRQGKRNTTEREATVDAFTSAQARKFATLQAEARDKRLGTSSQGAWIVTSTRRKST